MTQAKNKYANILSKVNNDQRGVQDSILIIDGLNTFLRSFTMINHINPDGHHIGGLTGFLKSVGYAIKMLDPTKVIIVFDGAGGSNSKRNLYPDYKANRNKSRMTNYSIFSSKDEENESINNQMARLIQYLQCLPVTMIVVDGVEADDIIGYLVGKFEKYPTTKEATVLSADKDFLQLVSSKVQVYSPTKKKIYKPKDVLEEFGVSSYNFVNYKILMGDSSDNLPGVSGLGPKKLIKMFPELAEDTPTTLGKILEKADSKIGEHDLYGRIVERKHQLEINSKLMNLQTVPLSPENMEKIKQDFNSPYELNNHAFMTMYLADKLGESIPNTPNWLNQVFGPLNNFK
jgi:5'-3' exonuclease